MTQKIDPAGITQMFDQLEANLTNQAKILASYYLSLREEGLSEELAGILTANLQERMIAGSNGE